MYDDELIAPWVEHALRLVPGASLVDIHAHTGRNDPDGFRFSAQELVRELEAVDARGVVIPMHEPAGYPRANDRVLAEAEASDGRLVAFCRLNPWWQPLWEARRCIAAGAAGLKLHPRAEQFTLDEPIVDAIFALAAEYRLPVLIHAGRGIPALGRDALRLATKYPDARVILGHVGLSDLNWIWRDAPGVPNLFFDLSSWLVSDLVAAISLIPPGQLLYASDLPYFTPMGQALIAIRVGLQVGLSQEQLGGILGGQATRILAREDTLELGSAPGPLAADGVPVMLERITAWLLIAAGRMAGGDSGFEAISIARLACDVGTVDTAEADACRSVLVLLDGQERWAAAHADDQTPWFPGSGSIMAAACIARTPHVPLPRVPSLESEAAVRDRSSAGHRTIDMTDLPAAIPATRDLRRSSAADHLAIDPSEKRGTSGVHPGLSLDPE